MKTEKQIWKNEGEKSILPTILKYISGEDILLDQNLVKYDALVNKAHAKMLAESGLITWKEYNKIKEALENLPADFKLKPELEDVHMNIEEYLTEKLGPVGMKVHTAKSRNDQVMADMALWMIDAAKQLKQEICLLISVLEKKASEYKGAAMPAYTHMQPAQKISTDYWLLAYAEMLKKELGQLDFFAENAKEECPLGACACAGTSLKTKPDLTAKELGFGKCFANALAAVSTRGELETKLVFCTSMIMLHLNKLANDIQLYSTFEFGMVALADEVCTSSSIMPQKKNPDALEIMHAKTAEVHSLLMQNLMILKSVPSGYNRDPQQTKAVVMAAVKIALDSLKVMKIIAGGISLNKKKMAEIVEKSGCTATEKVNALVLKGVPFREAYHTVKENFLKQ